MVDRYSLIPHSDHRPGIDLAVGAELFWTSPVRLHLRWTVSGAVNQVLTGRCGGGTGRTDELWRSTCFELFVRPPGGEAYVEFNVSGRCWAAYRFRRYRDGMEDARIEMAGAPWEAGDGHVSQTASIEWPAAALESLDSARLGLSAVIEEEGGRISYWALAHPGASPDFHHADCFVADLPPRPAA